jgi:hypothetical protein
MVQADTRRKKLRACTSNCSSVILSNGDVISAALPAGTGRMYAQIVVKVGHLRPRRDGDGNVIRLEGPPPGPNHTRCVPFIPLCIFKLPGPIS